MKQYLAITVVFLLLMSGWTVFIAVGSGFDGQKITNQQFHQRDQVLNKTDVPTWIVGEEWIYEAHIYSDTEDGFFDISSDDLKLLITDRGLTMHQDRFEQIYRVRIIGNISGSFQSSILSGDVTGMINGNVSMRQADLSMIESNITTSGIIEYLIILESDFEMTSTACYFPSFEYFDFPLNTNESWNISTTAYQNSSFYVENFFDNASEGTASMDGDASCLSLINITVPAGVFTSFHLLSQQENTSIESWYAPVVKNVAKLYMESTNETDVSQIWMNLTSYALQNQQVNITSSFSPPIVNVGDPVTLSGYVNETSTGTPVQNRPVTITIPAMNDTIQVNTDANGFYTATFSAPLILDATNTSYDIGSDGIIVEMNTTSYKGYTISTLTVIGLAIADGQAIPTVQFETLSVNCSAHIYTVAPLVEKSISITGPPGFTPVNTSLLEADHDWYYLNQSYTVLGNYSFFFWAKDSLGNTNSSPVHTFSVVPDTIAPEITDVQITPNPQYELFPVTVTAQITDNVAVDQVTITIADPQGSQSTNSMIDEDDMYSFSSSFSLVGNYSVVITATDTLGNTNVSSSYPFTIVPEVPVIRNVHADPLLQITDEWVNISGEVFDQNGLDMVKVLISGPMGFSPVNTSMTAGDGDQFYYDENYSVNGTYEYQIWVKDAQGNQNSSAWFSFEIINGSFLFWNTSLISGWNLIGIPVINTWNASDLADNLSYCNSVSCWDTLNQTYQTYIVGGPPSFDFTLQDGHGFFVDESDNEILSLVGIPIINVSVPLEVGWNLLSWYHTENTTASNLAGNITGCSSVSSWNATIQSYDTYIVGGPDTFDFVITSGMGVFVDVTQQSIWYGQG